MRRGRVVVCTAVAILGLPLRAAPAPDPVREAALVTYVHGMTRELARERVCDRCLGQRGEEDGRVRIERVTRAYVRADPSRC